MDMSLLPHRQVETLKTLYNFIKNGSKKYFQKNDFQPGNRAASLKISNLNVIQSGINPTFF